MQRGRAAALLVWASASACSEYDLPSLRYETEQAVIGTDISKPLCGYDLPWIDEQIEFTEGMLNAAADEKLEIYIYAKDVPEPCGGRAGVVGCYKPDEKIIASVWWAVDHEIVHAVADRFSDASVFWDEGIAEALRRGRPTIRGWIPVVQNASVDTSREVERFGAGHFVRWLINEYDIDTVRDLLTGTPPGEVTGNSLEDLSAMYESESMAAYPSWAPCDYPELANVGPGLWDETVEVSCRRPDVSRFGRFGEGAFTLLRSVELSGGRYEFKVSGGNVGARLLGCLTEPRAEPASSMTHGDTMSELEHSMTAPGVLFAADVVHEIELTAGVYKLAVPVEDEGAVVLSLRRIGAGRVDD